MTRSMACFKNMFRGKRLYVGNAIADAMFSSRGGTARFSVSP